MASLAADDGRRELAQAFGVGNRVDGGDLLVRHGEDEGDTRHTARRPYGAHGSVHLRWQRSTHAREPLGDLLRAAEAAPHAHRQARLVGAEHDLWIEYGE